MIGELDFGGLIIGLFIMGPFGLLAVIGAGLLLGMGAIVVCRVFAAIIGAFFP
jgi:hypothetical protein